ncbi:MAG: hypothetical protein RJA70_3930 [Pseudomonadota bacterium]
MKRRQSTRPGSQGTRRARAAPESIPPKRRRRRQPRHTAWALWIPLLAALGCGVTAAGLLWSWGTSANSAGHAPAETQPSEAAAVRIEFETEPSPEQVAEALAAAGLYSNTTRFVWFKRFYHPLARFEVGPHWLPKGGSPRLYIQLLARLQGRPATRVSLPEGWDSFQMAERLEQLGVCAAEDFLAEALASEGRLYPAAYDFRLNSEAKFVAERLRKEAANRLSALLTQEASALAQIETTYGLSEADVVTLASIVQKEAADPSEFGSVASVFLNRLSDETFRPLRMLQSDPTAGYGCKLPDRPASCVDYRGRISPQLLRDPANRYNTYRNPGLPPGPIGNPSAEAIHAVLHAPATTYLFFVSPNGGRHTFTRTLEEHQAATKSAK